MAHADYNCCALCDGKMEYASFYDATTKDDLCYECMSDLRDAGAHVLNGREFLEWIKSIPDEQLVERLSSLGYWPCYYDNPVDEHVMSRLGHDPDGPRRMDDWKKLWQGHR